MTVLLLLLVKRLDVVGSFAADIDCGIEGTGARFYVLGKGKDCWYTAQVLKVISFDETRLSIERQRTVPGVRLVIPIDPTVSTVRQPRRRVDLATQDKLDEKVEELLQRSMIEPVRTFSRGQSLVVRAKKGDNGTRLCVDMRMVNKAVVDEKFPLLMLEEFKQERRDNTVCRC